MHRKDPRYLALEAVVVLFGVLAALFVDGIRDEAARQDAAAAGVERLFAEASQNLNELRDLSDVVNDRLVLIRALRDDAQEDAGLADLVARFHGYRTPDLSEGAWQRLSGSSLADSVDPELLAEGFYLYQLNRHFSQLDQSINQLVYSELFYEPEGRATAIAISERIMEQQTAWANEIIPRYEQFLSRADQ